MNAADAASLGVEDGQEVVLANERGELTIRAKISESVLPGSVFVPLYYDGGAVTALFGHEDGALARVRITGKQLSPSVRAENSGRGTA